MSRGFPTWTSYGKNIHIAIVSRVEGGSASELGLDWVENHQPFLLSRMDKNFNRHFATAARSTLSGRCGTSSGF